MYPVHPGTQGHFSGPWLFPRAAVASCRCQVYHKGKCPGNKVGYAAVRILGIDSVSQKIYVRQIFTSKK